MDRRLFLQHSSALAGLGLLSGCARHVASPVTAQATAPTAGKSGLPFYDLPGAIVPIRADMDRIFRITVCLRPFRAAGPRIEAERVGDKTVVHNYGHGGSGWSLSWGSAAVAIGKAMPALDGRRELAVIGCGAMGLTSALTAQRAGLKVTIYAKERPPFVRSSRATGSWTPDSRVALEGAPAPEFAAQWEQMARTSFAMYQSYLGAPGNPVEWVDFYNLQERSSKAQNPKPERPEKRRFARYMDRISDISVHGQDLPAGTHPFPASYDVRRSSSMTFNIADYARQLMNDFLIAGGTIETREFHTPADVAALPQSVVIHCTGYAARQLWSDESVIPVRGQIGWLIPQENAHYGMYFGDMIMLARRDGIVIQTNPQGDDTGWNDDNEQPDRAMTEAGVRELQGLYARMQASHA
jgi:D-amino-acid oxidase